MKITVRGWARDCGTTVLADHDLTTVEYKSDKSRSVWRDKPALFSPTGGVFVAWCQKFRHVGDYRMEIELTTEEVLHLFKLHFGTELEESHLDILGFTVSPELTKRILRTVKLSDVTLGDLAAMNTSAGEPPATAEKLVEASPNLTPFRSRV
jgi:hypothetical protein